MSKASQSNPLSFLKKNVWAVTAVASLLVNVGLVGAYQYMLYYNQFPLIQSQVSVRCNEPGYSRFMHQIASVSEKDGANREGSLKFAAASLCWTDYETGKPIDLKSVKPLTEWGGGLTPKPE